MKICKRCNLSKPENCFSKHAREKGGLRRWCRECSNKSSSLWRKQNPEKHRIDVRRSYYRKMNDRGYRKKRADYQKKQRKIKPEIYRGIAKRRREKIKDTIYYKLITICNSLSRRTVKGWKSSKVDYTPEQVRQRIEMNFKDGMCWGNWGKWHIDHKKPIKRFVDQGKTDPRLINCLANLQPLWAKDNLAKGAK